jgi:hypothetical protein
MFFNPRKNRKVSEDTGFPACDFTMKNRQDACVTATSTARAGANEELAAARCKQDAQRPLHRHAATAVRCNALLGALASLPRSCARCYRHTESTQE